jgi:site-specific DNA recombinase
MTISLQPPQKTEEVHVKRAALVMRVSTDRQARNEEGSLKNQLQRLRQHIDYKVNSCGENWNEAGVYELKSISGKNSMRSQEFQRLFADIEAGKVNTVLCTALDRICRSVKDFLWFFEFLNEQHTEFVCLKQNYDTTSAQGRLLVMIMMALAQFEREQTSERTSDAAIARAERGLWNGGKLLGYDPDPNHKSTLIPNPEEAAIVTFAFDKYLECGSVVETTNALNGRGYRTKSYTSRRDILHPGLKFNVSAVHYLLRNLAYIGRKEINKKNINKKIPSGKVYRLVDAVWQAIVSPEKFEAAQRLLCENGQTKRNAAEPILHTYVLSRGILHCGRCGADMEGRSGTGRMGIKYFYYACQNKDCNLKISASEIEDAILERIKYLASDEAIIQRLTEETNSRLLKQKPALEKQKQSLTKSLAEIKNQADKVIELWAGLEDQDGKGFIRDKLNDLAHRKTELEDGLVEIEQELKQIQGKAVEADTVRAMLLRISELYAQLKPFEQRDLISLVLKSAKVDEKEITLEIYALGDAVQLQKTGDPSVKVRPTSNWLPGLVSQSVLLDRFPCHLPSLDRRCRVECRARTHQGLDKTASEWREMLDQGLVKNRAELARRMGVTRARVTQVLGVQQRINR